MLINKDHGDPHQVRIVFQDAGKTDTSFSGPVTVISFGKAQYQWHPGQKNGYADPDGPPAVSSITATPGTMYTLPAASVTVMRGSADDASRPEGAGGRVSLNQVGLKAWEDELRGAQRSEFKQHAHGREAASAGIADRARTCSFQ